MNRSSISSVLWGWAATSGGPAPDDDDPDADDAFLRFALALALALDWFRRRFFFRLSASFPIAFLVVGLVFLSFLFIISSFSFS